MPSSSCRRTGASRSASSSWITRRWRSASPRSRRSRARWASPFCSASAEFRSRGLPRAKTPKGVRFAAAGFHSKRGVEETEPLAQVLLDGELLLELRLQLELARVVAFLLHAGRHERPERAGLEAVDPVHGMLAAFEAEGGREQLRAEAALDELLCDRVDRGHLILELRVAHDHPLEAERVGLAVELGARARRDALQELLDVVVDLRELAGRQRLEDDRARARGLRAALDGERDGGGREREQAVARRLLQFLAPEEDVPEPHYDCCVPGSISLALSPAPTSDFSFASSSSTWLVAEICASSRSSCVRLSPMSSSAPEAVSSSIADARACSSSVLSLARWIAMPVSSMPRPMPVAASPILTCASAAEYCALITSFCERNDSMRVSSCCCEAISFSCWSASCCTCVSSPWSCCCAAALRSSAWRARSSRFAATACRACVSSLTTFCSIDWVWSSSRFFAVTTSATPRLTFCSCWSICSYE